MATLTIHEAKTHLARLIKDVLAGGEVAITQGRAGEELVKLVPARPAVKPRRTPGWLAHELPAGTRGVLESGFWDPLFDEEDGSRTGCCSTPTLCPSRPSGRKTK